MDNIRFVLIFAFAFILYSLWEAWQIDYGPKPDIVAIEQPATDFQLDVPGTVDETTDEEIIATETQSELVSVVPLMETESSRVIDVKTDLLRLQIDTKGGTIKNLFLLDYPLEDDDSGNVIELLDGTEEKLFLAQSGLISGSGSASLPNHHSVLNAEKFNYELYEDQNALRIPLTWTNGEGVKVTKTYILERGSYVVTVEQKVTNSSGKTLSGRQYAQLLRKPYSDEKGNTFIRTYAGGVVYTEEDKYQKISYDDMDDENLDVVTMAGWSAMIQHYFATAWIPPNEEENHFYTKKLPDQRYVIGSYSQQVQIIPDTESVFSSRLFSGPKIQPMMEKITAGLELTVDYSWLTIVAKPIYWLLNKIYLLVGNWGFAIIGVTLVIKSLFFKLSEASYKSMAKMRKIQPKLKELKEKYADDRQRFNTEMMAMYKKEKVNPMGGCLPILVQIPVFISLYWVLIESVELRQAPFILWIKDLSVMDPYYVLPVLMGITMKLQQSLNPPPIDPVQAKVMKMFPLIFTVFFLFFPAGLVLYWVVNNSLSFVQQWYITRKIEAANN